MLGCPSPRQQLSNGLLVFVFLLVLSSCRSAPSDNHNQANQPSPTPTPTSTQGFMPRLIVDTWNNIHLFETFDYNISNPASIAGYYDFVWGARADHVEAIRAGNPNILISYYISFFRDDGIFAESHTYHDLAYWKATHPDWILYRCDRVTPAYEFGNPNMPLDFSNPEVVAWQIQTYALPASSSGYGALAADNLVMTNLSNACGSYINGKWVQRYTGQRDDVQWRKDVITWATQMQQALHHLPHPLALIANFDYENLSPQDAQVQQIISHLDGISDEPGFTHYGQSYLTGNDWVQKIEFMESVQEQHKAYYVINQFPSIGRDEIQWALASYLMGKEHSAALFISTYQGYGSDTRYDEYNAPIGSPLGPMYHSQGVYVRKYSNGLSIVNPSATDTDTISLDSGKSYRDLYGNTVMQAVTMPPHSGLVLLNAT
jgi:hypothetical protein